MNKISEKEWIEDFQEFVQAGASGVPSGDDIKSQVWSDLNPPGWLVFAKLASVHTVVGTLSLAICDQFGITPFQTGFTLSDYFMKFGHSTCMVLCGVLFLGLSAALCRLTFRPEDLRVLRRNSWLQIFALSLLSIGIFAALGAQITFAIALLWITGAVLGGSAILATPSLR